MMKYMIVIICSLFTTGLVESISKLLAAHIQGNRTYYIIGTPLEVKCAFNGTYGSMSMVSLVNGTKRKIPLDDKITVTNNTATLHINEIPEEWIGIHHLHCQAFMDGYAPIPALKRIFCGYKLEPVESIECVGSNFDSFTCRLQPSFSKSRAADKIVGHRLEKWMEANVFVLSKTGHRERCKNVSETSLRSSEFSCRFNLSEDGNLTVVHKPWDLMNTFDINIQYCNNFGCSEFNTSRNRSEFERPSMNCFLETHPSVDGFSFEISRRNFTTGMVYRHSVRCESKNLSHSHNMSTSGVTGTVSDLLPGNLYECNLHSAFTFGGLWSESCPQRVRTLETVPDAGPIFYPGFFSRDESGLNICFLPPPARKRNGRIVEFGLSGTGSPPPIATSRRCCLRTRERPPFFLLARTARGWGRASTRVVPEDVPDADSALAAPSLDLWRRGLNLYDVDAAVPAGAASRFLICRRSLASCRSELGNRGTLRVDLAEEMVALTVSLGGRTSGLSGWVVDHCLRVARPRLESAWISAREECGGGGGGEVAVRINSSRLRCSSTLRAPIRRLVVRRRCAGRVTNFTLSRSEGAESVLKLASLGHNCSLEAGVPDGPFIALRVEHCEEAPHPSWLPVGIGILMALLVLLLLVFCVVRMVRSWIRQARDGNPATGLDLTPERLLMTADYNYPSHVAQGLAPYTETTNLTTSTSPPFNDVSMGVLGDTNPKLEDEDEDGASYTSQNLVNVRT